MFPRRQRAKRCAAYSDQIPSSHKGTFNNYAQYTPTTWQHKQVDSSWSVQGDTLTIVTSSSVDGKIPRSLAACHKCTSSGERSSGREARPSTCASPDSRPDFCATSLRTRWPTTTKLSESPVTSESCVSVTCARRGTLDCRMFSDSDMLSTSRANSAYTSEACVSEMNEDPVAGISVARNSWRELLMEIRLGSLPKRGSRHLGARPPGSCFRTRTSQRSAVAVYGLLMTA